MKMARQALLEHLDKTTKPCNQRPTLVQTNFLVYKNRSRSPPPSPGTLSRSSGVDSTLAGVVQNSPGNWVAGQALKTVGTRCPRHSVSNRSAREGSACPRACAFAFPIPGSATSGRGSAFLRSRIPAPGSLFFHAFLNGTLSRLFYSSRASFDASPRPPVSAGRISDLVRICHLNWRQSENTFVNFDPEWCFKVTWSDFLCFLNFV